MYDCQYSYTAGDASTSPQLASSTCAVSTSTPAIATTSDIVILPTMSAGEVLICFFLFVLVLMQLAHFVFSALDRIQTKKKVLGYGGGDVEIREEV